MAADPEREPSRDNIPGLTIKVKGHDIILHKKNTVFRAFEQGEGVYDHCVVALPDGNFHAFLPDADMRFKLFELGVRVKDDETVDLATAEVSVGEMRGQMEEGLGEST